MAEGLALAEEAKHSLERLNYSITSVVKVLTAPFTIISGEIAGELLSTERPGAVHAVLVMYEGSTYILKMTWAAIQSVMSIDMVRCRPMLKVTPDPLALSG